eukprot:Hpha_TRINITY_DN15253_c0_g1::TRINITY_DN15253_c0_g1_i1::g.67215::m.67215
MENNARYGDPGSLTTKLRRIPLRCSAPPTTTGRHENVEYSSVRVWLFPGIARGSLNVFFTVGFVVAPPEKGIQGAWSPPLRWSPGAPLPLPHPNVPGCSSPFH